MLETIISTSVETLTTHAATWGFVLIFVFMTIESSFIPFPSEVVMIPAGFLAYRGVLTFENGWIALVLAIIIGLAGSMLGAYINYYLSYKLGRPFLHKYGRYFFLPEQKLNRAEELFRHYGELTTFVCRLLPGIRQLISIPAGLVKMNFKRFSLFTALGAGIWVIILALIGWYLGHLSQNMSNAQIISKGKELINDNLIWLLIGLAVLIGGYFICEHIVMKGKIKKSAE